MYVTQLVPSAVCLTHPLQRVASGPRGRLAEVFVVVVCEVIGVNHQLVAPPGRQYECVWPESWLSVIIRLVYILRTMLEGAN